MASVRRTALLAYLIGAGVAGTLIVGPYTGRALIAAVSPEFARLTAVPFFLLPVAWGLWNWLRLRLRPRVGIGLWGALLGITLAVAVNLLLYVEGRWFTGALFLPVVIPALYFLFWRVVVGPLNDALGVE